MNKWKITKEYRYEWRKKNLEKVRAYDREWKRKYKLEHPEKIKTKRKERYYRERKNPEWVEKRKEYMRAYQKKWRDNNPKYRVRHSELAKIRYHKRAKEIYAIRRAKPYEKLVSSIRSRIRDLLRNGYKSARTEKLLGCTMKELKEHLEKQFKSGMTWENYGFYGWHVDHILPLSSFDLTNPDEQKKHFTIKISNPYGQKKICVRVQNSLN